MLNALGKLSAMARKNNQSTTFTAEWSSICSMHRLSPKKLITPAPTRWNSRFEQIDRAKKYKAVYRDMINANYDTLHQYTLSDAEWSLLDWLHGILYTLNICSKYVGITKSPSIGFMIPCFSRLIDQLENQQVGAGLETPSEKADRMDAIEKAQAKLMKYYSHTVENPYYTFGLCEFAPSSVKLLLISPLS